MVNLEALEEESKKAQEAEKKEKWVRDLVFYIIISIIIVVLIITGIIFWFHKRDDKGEIPQFLRSKNPVSEPKK